MLLLERLKTNHSAERYRAYRLFVRPLLYSIRCLAGRTYMFGYRHTGQGTTFPLQLRDLVATRYNRAKGETDRDIPERGGRLQTYNGKPTDRGRGGYLGMDRSRG
jgi:hypothetical protein